MLRRGLIDVSVSLRRVSSSKKPSDFVRIGVGLTSQSDGTSSSRRDSKGPVTIDDVERVVFNSNGRIDEELRELLKKRNISFQYIELPPLAYVSDYVFCD